ncbi:hypothetical protein [Neomoorella mulderi]|nr:hypothetical protein [Moorella mulderi]
MNYSPAAEGRILGQPQSRPALGLVAIYPGTNLSRRNQEHHYGNDE